MKITRRNPMTLPALALGLASVLLAPASLRAAPGGMQVEEPALGAPKPPIQPELDQQAWKSKRQAGLTAEQKAALKARQETMKDMMVLIQKKRLAIRDARPEQREALAQELHSLILEKGHAERARGRAGARAEGRKDSSPDLARPGQDDATGLEANARVRDVREVRGKAADQKARHLELKEELLRQQEALRQEILRQQEARRQAWEEKLEQLEEKLKQKVGDD